MHPALPGWYLVAFYARASRRASVRIWAAPGGARDAPTTG
jgi:hypothetical protein